MELSWRSKLESLLGASIVTERIPAGGADIEWLNDAGGQNPEAASRCRTARSG